MICNRLGRLVFWLGLGVLMTVHATRVMGGEVLDWSRPQAIDPLAKHVQDFLDTDLSKVERDALHAFSKKAYSEAAQHFLFLLRHRNDDVTALYNLACCYSKMGQPKLAGRCLEKVADVGFVDVERVLADPDFEPILQEPAFKKAIETMRRARESWGQVLFVPACKLVKCHVRVPRDFDPQKETVLVVGLHGNGGKAEQFVKLWDRMEHRDFVFAVPEGAYPKPSTAGGLGGGFSWEIQIRDEELWRRGDPLTIAYIADVVGYLSSGMKIKEVYLLGFSQGAAYAYLTGISKPDLFDGIICFGGRLPSLSTSYSVCSEEDLKKAHDLGVFIGHGTGDRAIGIQAGLDAKSVLEAAGYDVVFRRFDGGHEIPAEVLNAALSWMKRRAHQDD